MTVPDPEAMSVFSARVVIAKSFSSIVGPPWELASESTRTVMLRWADTVIEDLRAARLTIFRPVDESLES